MSSHSFVGNVKLIEYKVAKERINIMQLLLCVGTLYPKAIMAIDNCEMKFDFNKSNISELNKTKV